MSIFEIVGHSMIGSQNSHIAAACRLGWAARTIVREPIRRAKILLHGSFPATGKCQYLKEAIIAGLLGLPPDSLNLHDSMELAEDENLDFEFGEIDPGPQLHPNSVKMVLYGDRVRQTVTASCVGGGAVFIAEIDALPVCLRGALETLLLWHLDTPGFLARITSVLACVQTNVANIQTSRTERGERALTAVEIDGILLPEVIALLQRAPAVQRLSVLPALPGF